MKVGSLAGTAIDPSKPMLEIGPAGVTVMGGPAGPVQLKITPAGVNRFKGQETIFGTWASRFSPVRIAWSSC